MRDPIGLLISVLVGALLALLVIALTAHAADVARLDADITTGVAPLAVMFDAGASTDDQAPIPWHQLVYSFEFGEKRRDPTYARVWGLDGDDFLRRLSKDNYVGAPLAGHVYETPGTYTASVVVRDPNGNTTQATRTINVSDPAVVYPGAQTECRVDSVKPDSYVGCPPGAAQISNASFAAAATAASSGKRVLLRRGDTFTGTGTVNPSSGGILAAYGSGPRPRVTGADTILKVGGNGARVVDLDLVSSCVSNCPLGNGVIESQSTTVAMTRALLLRVRSANGFGGYSAKGGGSTRHQWSAVDCEFDDVASRTDGKEGGKQMDGDVTGSMFLGNLLGASPVGFNARFYGFDDGVFTFNKFAGGNNKTSFRIHAPTSPASENFVFGYNTWGPGTNETAEMKPASTSFYTEIRNYIVEGNYIPTGTNTMRLFGQRVSVRNNIKKGSGSGGGGMMAKVERLELAAPDGSHTTQYPTKDLWFANNTCYFTSSTAGPCIEALSDVAGPVDARNNLLYAPADGDAVVTRGMTSTANNGFYGSGVAPPLLAAAPSQILDYRRTPAVLALNVGASLDGAFVGDVRVPPLPPSLVDVAVQP